MQEEDFEVSMKVVVVGNGNVGKSSMIKRFCKKEYLQNYKKTIGVEYLERELQIQGESVRIMVWDCAGQEEFDQITKDYYHSM
jgi:Ras-related protein Rab-23